VPIGPCACQGGVDHPGSQTCLGRGHLKESKHGIPSPEKYPVAGLGLYIWGRTDDMFNSSERCSADAGQGRCGTSEPYELV